MNKRLLFSIIMVLILLASCQAATTIEPTTAPTPSPAPAMTEMILATTTSTQDSGLLDVLIPAFEKKSGYAVKVVAVGSGAALKMGEEGNADVLFVHSPAAEAAFMEKGFGDERRLVMHNDFVIVGPSADPAGIKGLSAVGALKKIAAAEATFVARGDESGTSTKELGLWKKAELDPKGTMPAWYIETGQGMGATLTIASEKGAYTLTDRATFLANKANLSLEILLEGENALLNIYHVITVSPAKWPEVNTAGAEAFAEFVLSAEGREIISAFGVEKYGQPLFFWDGDKTDADLGLK